MKISITNLVFAFCLLGIQTTYSQVEICWNRVDDDGDGKIDCLDQECINSTFCYECDENLHIIFDNKYFGTLSVENGIYTNLFKLKGVSEINGAAFNHKDGHIYASAKTGNGSSPRLVMINQNGKSEDLGLWHTTNDVYFMGAFDQNGILYQANYDSEIMFVDVNVSEPEYKSTGILYPGGTDFAFSRINGLLYSVSNENELIEINVNTKDVKKYNLAGPINQEVGYYGSMWSTSDGGLFALNGVSGKIYSLDVTNFQATEVLNATGNFSWLDGLNCLMANSTFETSCKNGIDDDGDGLLDCDDPDCEKSNLCIVEICNNGLDDDGDGKIDCMDSECQAFSYCTEVCDNGLDDDGDGLIDDLDPDCSTTTSNQGGLESNDNMVVAIAKRNNARRKRKVDKKDFLKYEQSINKLKNVRNEIDLRAFIVQNTIPESETFISTPTDLIQLTNATDVFATDVYKDSKRVASTLLLKTEGEVYEHTKTICDRLDGAQITDISTILYEDKQLIMAEIMQRNGIKEYALSFSIHFEEGNSHIENYWKQEKYTQKEGAFVNMQIWANSINHLNLMLNKSIEKINQIAPIRTINTGIPPRVYISHAELKNGDLKMFVKNKNNSKQIRIEGNKTLTELGEKEHVMETFEMNGSIKQHFVIPLESAFNVGLRMTSEKGDVDDLFIADGIWGVDYNEDVDHLTVYQINNNDSQSIDEETSYKLNRNISLKAKVSENLSIYRSINIKFSPEDLDEYNFLSFEASGNVILEVSLINHKIENWDDQARTQIILNEESHEYKLSKDEFISKMPIDWKEIESIHFKYKHQSNNPKDIEINLNNLSFNNDKNESSSQAENLNNISIQPNPFNDTARCLISSETDETYTLSIINAEGKQVDQMEGIFLKGMNEISLKKLSYMEKGFYFIQIITSEGRIIGDKFLISE